MKKAGLILLVLVILGGWAFKGSEAGQWCWQFTGYPDNYIKLSFAKPDPLYPYWSLNGMWYVPGESIVPLVGTMVKSADGTQRLLNLNGAIPGTTGLSQAYQMEAVIDSLTKNGTIYIYYTISTDNSAFAINNLKCSTLPSP